MSTETVKQNAPKKVVKRFAPKGKKDSNTANTEVILKDSSTEDSAEDSDFSVEELTGQDAEDFMTHARAAQQGLCKPAKKEKDWAKGKAQWQIAGLKSEEEAKAQGYYEKGMKCLTCGKVFARKKFKAVHDALCDGTIKRCGNAKKGTSSSKKDYIKELIAKMEDFDLDVPDVFLTLTMDIMFQYLIERNKRYDDNVRSAMKNKQFRKATLKWMDSLGDITIKKTRSTVCTFSGGYKFKESIDEDDTVKFTDYVADDDLTRWITEM